jgi:hypothetical protein
MSDLELYISQNSNPDVQRSRQIRMALRALDGQRVTWPYVHTYVSSDVGLPYKALPFFLYSPLEHAFLGLAEANDTKYRHQCYTSKLSCA